LIAHNFFKKIQLLDSQSFSSIQSNPRLKQAAGIGIRELQVWDVSRWTLCTLPGSGGAELGYRR